MDSLTIPQFYNTLSRKCRGLDPLLLEWEDVELSQLSDLETFLDDELVNFQNLVLEDKQNGYMASSFVTNIRTTFNTFLQWVGELPNEYLNPEDSDSEKENILRNICLELSCLWIPWLDSDYEPLVKGAKIVPDVAPIEMRTEQIKFNRQEKMDAEQRTRLFNVIIGSTPDEKKRIYEAMQSIVRGKGGKQLALCLKAAIELGLLSEVPHFDAMKRFWGITKSQPALSKCLSSVDDTLHEKDVESRKSEIAHLLWINN